MKKPLALLITLALLIGLIATIATSRVQGEVAWDNAKNCGWSVSSTSGARTQLHGCALATYGWPIKYITGNARATLRDYHTIDPSDASDFNSLIVFVSISRLRFVEDWILWSIAAGVVVGAISIVVPMKQTPMKPKKGKK